VKFSLHSGPGRYLPAVVLFIAAVLFAVSAVPHGHPWRLIPAAALLVAATLSALTNTPKGRP
jgi:hypothetical protein